MAKKAYIGVPFTQPKLGDLTEGTVVKINENGSPIDFYVAKHNYESGLNGEGKTLLVRKCIYGNSKAFDTTSAYSNLFADNYVDEYLNGKYKNVLDSVVQSAITNTTFYYTSKNSSSATVSTLSRGVFLLSLAEFGLTMTSTNAEGSTLPIANMLLLVTKDDGTSLGQWTRTPRLGESSGVVVVNTNGTTATVSSSNNLQAGFRPCFTLPADLGVFDGVVTGAQAETTTKSVARKIKKGYIGVENLARKIKKAYIGIGGVARPCWSGGELAYYGTITPLDYSRYYLAATSVGDYALFGGGLTSSDSNTNKIDAYDSSLVRTSPTAMNINRDHLAATSVGNYALFCCGQNGSSYVATVEPYDTSLTRGSSLGGAYSVCDLAAATVGNYALFGGGAGRRVQSAMQSISNSLTVNNSVTSLSVARANLAATTVGGYAIFGGGTGSGGAKQEVDAYDASLTHVSNISSLSGTKRYHAATTVGDYALIGPCYSNSAVDVYDSSLTHSTTAQPALYGDYGSATSIGDYAIFARGLDSLDDVYFATAEVYDASLTKVFTFELSVARSNMAATTVGNYALFGGGIPISGASDVVDAFTIA